MHKFTRQFLTEWRRLNLSFDDGKILAAVSGGADSCALAAVLRDLKERGKLSQPIVVAHFNHRLRGAASDADEEFVRRLAADYEFEFVAGKWDSPAKKNVEAAAREARYKFLQAAANSVKANLIVSAHTVNDQAETFLINLLRGSGLEGLSAMRAKRALNSADSTENIWLIRPLLDWARREDTEEFCRCSKIEFRRDRMNEDLHFRRVQVRREVLPLLGKYNPKIVETLARTAHLIAADAEILRQTAHDKLNGDEKFLRVADLKMLSPNLLPRVLREWLKNVRGHLRGLEMKHLTAIEKLINSRKSGRIVELPKGEIVCKSGGKLIFKAAEKGDAEN